ncbi:hypothetical protein [Calidifontibacter indicus]|uniref:hypothetical protein n=1 Tax=Calidifontibacter indicus TaxID=419650 RepID=UPI003D7371F7
MKRHDATPLKYALDALTNAGRATDFRATDANIATAQVFAVLELADQVGRVADALAAPHQPAKADQ